MKKVRKIVLMSFFPIVFLNALLGMFGYHYDRFFNYPLLIAAFLVIISPLLSVKRNVGASFVTIWLFYNVFSVIMYAVNGRPLDCYIGMLLTYVFPIFFFYFGNNRAIDSDIFYKQFTLLCFAVFIYGFYLYAFMPGYYISFLTDLYNDSWYTSGNLREESMMYMSRFSSIFGSSYAISYLSIPCLCFSLKRLIESDTTISRIGNSLIVSVSWVAAVLCQQRVAMAVATAILGFSMFYVNKKDRQSSRTLLVLVLLIVAIAIAYLGITDRMDIISEMITSRIEGMNLQDAYEVEGRPYQYITSINNMNNVILGDGLGAASSIARSHGFPGVSDGEFVRVFVENGIIGSMIFMFLLTSTVVVIIKNRKSLMWEGFVVLFFLAAAMVSNSLSINMFYAPIFWFSMGRIWLKTESVSVMNSIE